MDSGVEGKISYLEESITTYLKVQIFERKTEAFKANHNSALDISKSEKLFSTLDTNFKVELRHKIEYIIKINICWAVTTFSILTRIGDMSKTPN